MSDCPACADASEHPLGGWYRLTDCRECGARWLARSPAYADAAAAGAITPRYRDALVARFGADWRAGHERVKAWAAVHATCGAVVRGMAAFADRTLAEYLAPDGRRKESASDA